MVTGQITRASCPRPFGASLRLFKFAPGEFVTRGRGSATGDLNYDGVVDAIDVLRAQRILLGLVTPDVDELLRGDVAPVIAGSPAPDGLFNPGDLLVIQRLALGQGFSSPWL